MSDNETNPKDQRLTQLMGTWKMEAPLPPRFQEQVWHRIALEEGAASQPWWRQWSVWLEAALRRPVLATAYLGLFLVAGAATGYWQANQKSTELNTALSERYLQSFDPYYLAQR